MGKRRHEGGQEQKNRNLFLLARERDFPNHCSCHQRRQRMVPEGDGLGKALSVLRHRDQKKAHVASSTSVGLFPLHVAHCLWGLSRTTPISIPGKRPPVCGATGLRAHTHAFPLLRTSGCVCEGTKAALEKLQAATPPTPFTCQAGVSFPLGSLDV